MRRAWTLLLPFLLLLPLMAQEETVNSPLLAVLEGELYRVEGDALQAYASCQPDER